MITAVNEVISAIITMGHLQLFCLSLVLAVPGLRPVATSSRSSREVLFGLMTGDRSARAGVESAINDVNERTDLLSDFTLKIVRISVDLEVRYIVCARISVQTLCT